MISKVFLCYYADVLTIVSMIGSGETYLTYGDIPAFLIMLLKEDAEYAGAVGYNILLGLLFAGIGVFALLRKTGKEVAGTEVVDLK